MREQVLVIGMDFICDINFEVVRCGRFGVLVIIMLLFMWGLRLSSGWGCCEWVCLSWDVV